MWKAPVLLSCFLLFCFGTLFPLMAQTEESIHVLKSVQIRKIGDMQRVELEFVNGVHENPVLNFETNSLSIRFRNTILAPDLPQIIPPQNSLLIQTAHISAAPESNSVRLEAFFKPESKIAPVKILRGANSLFLELTLLEAGFAQDSSKKLETSSQNNAQQLSQDDSLKQEVADRVQQGDALPFSFQSLPENQTQQQVSKLAGASTVVEQDWTRNLLWSLLSLALVLSLIFLLAYLYNHFFAGKFPASRGKLSIRLISSFHIAPRQKVVVLEINGRYYACGSTPTSINLLTQIEDPKDNDFLNDVKLDSKTQEMRLDRSRVDFLKALKAARQHTEETENFYVPEEDSAPIPSSPLPSPSATFSTELEQAQSETSDLVSESQSQKGDSSVEAALNFQSPIYPPLEEASEKSKFEGNPLMQDFANKLSERVKKLKPIR